MLIIPLINSCKRDLKEVPIKASRTYVDVNSVDIDALKVEFETSIKSPNNSLAVSSAGGFGKKIVRKLNYQEWRY